MPQSAAARAWQLIDWLHGFRYVRFGLVGYQVEDYRADVEYIYMFAPLIWFLRCIGISIFLLGGTNMKSGQFYAYLLVEGAYLYYLVKSKVKASRFENWLSYFNEGSQIVYLFAQVISYHSSDTDFKQKQVGFAQAGILVSVMVMNIGYTFLIFGWTCLVQPLVRLCRRKKVARPDRIPAEQLQAAAKEAKESEAAKKKKEEKKVVISTFRTLMKLNAGKKLVDQSKHDLGSVGSLISLRFASTAQQGAFGKSKTD